jgi:hypothetical protein
MTYIPGYNKYATPTRLQAWEAKRADKRAERFKKRHQAPADPQIAFIRALYDEAERRVRR